MQIDELKDQMSLNDIFEQKLLQQILTFPSSSSQPISYAAICVVLICGKNRKGRKEGKTSAQSTLSYLSFLLLRKKSMSSFK